MRPLWFHCHCTGAGSSGGGGSTAASSAASSEPVRVALKPVRLCLNFSEPMWEGMEMML